MLLFDRLWDHKRSGSLLLLLLDLLLLDLACQSLLLLPLVLAPLDVLRINPLLPSRAVVGGEHGVRAELLATDMASALWHFRAVTLRKKITEIPLINWPAELVKPTPLFWQYNMQKKHRNVKTANRWVFVAVVKLFRTDSKTCEKEFTDK